MGRLAPHLTESLSRNPRSSTLAELPSRRFRLVFIRPSLYERRSCVRPSICQISVKIPRDSYPYTLTAYQNIRLRMALNLEIRGLEPLTYGLQSRRSSQLSYIPRTSVNAQFLSVSFRVPERNIQKKEKGRTMGYPWKEPAPQVPGTFREGVQDTAPYSGNTVSRSFLPDPSGPGWGASFAPRFLSQ